MEGAKKAGLPPDPAANLVSSLVYLSCLQSVECASWGTGADRARAGVNRPGSPAVCMGIGAPARMWGGERRIRSPHTREVSEPGRDGRRGERGNRGHSECLSSAYREACRASQRSIGQIGAP